MTSECMSQLTSDWKRKGRGNPRNTGELIHCLATSAAGIPGEPAKVAMIIVDRVGSEVPLSGEEGNCVQWR
jgi:hypothetical protein